MIVATPEYIQFTKKLSFMSQENIAFKLHMFAHMQQSVDSEVHSLNKMLSLKSLFSTRLGQQHQQEKITLFSCTDSQSQLN